MSHNPRKDARTHFDWNRLEQRQLGKHNNVYLAYPRRHFWLRIRDLHIFIGREPTLIALLFVFLLGTLFSKRCGIKWHRSVSKTGAALRSDSNTSDINRPVQKSVSLHIKVTGEDTGPFQHGPRVSLWCLRIQMRQLVAMEWEDIILGSQESLDGLKKLVFRHFSHNFCWESGDQGRGPAK